VNKSTPIFLLILTLSVYACTSAPSQNAIETAIAQTQFATSVYKSTFTSNITPTLVPSLTPTSTLQSTDTPTPTESPTATPTFTPTPDLRIITDTSDKFLLKASDLPSDARYYLPNSSWISPHHNYEIISDWGREGGLEYLEKSGRIDGWWVDYLRGARTVRAPEVVFHNIIQYKTTAGAQLTVLEFNYIASGVDTLEWEYVERDMGIGDVSLSIRSKEMQPNGKYRVWLRVEVAYRNYVSIVMGYGWEDEVSLDYIRNIALVALEKLKSAPLSPPGSLDHIDQ